jgi:hypothetical protein
MRDLIPELNRRRVFRVTGIHAIVASIVVQVAATTSRCCCCPLSAK